MSKVRAKRKPQRPPLPALDPLQRPPLPALDPLQRYEVPEANALLRQSNAKTYGDIKSGKIRVIRDGGRTYIPGSEIVRLSSLQDTAA